MQLRWVSRDVSKRWTSPSLVDTFLDSRCPPFEFRWTEIAQGGVAAAPVIEPFHIGEDGTLGLLPCLKPLPMNQLGFQGGKEALDHGIVPTVARPTHGTLDTTHGELVPVAHGCVLAAPIRMMEQAALD